MTINGLWKWIDKHAHKCKRERRLIDYHGKCVAIDTSIAIFQWIAVGHKRNITNSRGEPVNHLQGILYRGLAMLRAGIEPIWVFDGPAHKEKAAVIARRKLTRTVSVPARVWKESAELLQLLGWRTTIAPYDAEATAAALTRSRQGVAVATYAVATEDGDAFMFGARRVLRGLKADGAFVEYDMRVMLQESGLSFAQFQYMCVLAGTDYAPDTMDIEAAYAIALQTRHPVITPQMKKIVSHSATAYIKKRRSPRWKLLRKYLVDEHDLLPVKIDNAIAELRM